MYTGKEVRRHSRYMSLATNRNQIKFEEKVAGVKIFDPGQNF